MNFIKELSETGEIPYYDLYKEAKNLISLPDSKPSKRIIKTKKGRTAIAGLKNIETKHNHSWYKELFKRNYQWKRKYNRFLF